MEVDFELVKRFFEGDKKKGDEDQIIDWFSDIRFEEDVKRKFRFFWDSMDLQEDPDACDASRILGNIYHKIKKDEFENPAGKKGVVRLFSILQKVAAVLIIPLAIYLWLIEGSDSVRTASTAYSEIYSPPGARTRFYLTDGSTGWLNGGSYLKFPTEFRGKSREVRLKGEAYFDVITDSKKPFIVQGAKTSVVAHGTSFNIQAYPEDPEVWITLASGSIDIFEKVNGKTLELTELNPDQICIYQQDKRSYRVEKVDAKKIIAWTEGKLVFREESMVQVARRIERWFNVRIILADKELENYSFRATFQDDKLEDVMRLLAMTSPITYEITPRKLLPDGTYTKEVVIIYKTR